MQCLLGEFLEEAQGLKSECWLVREILRSSHNYVQHHVNCITAFGGGTPQVQN